MGALSALTASSWRTSVITFIAATLSRPHLSVARVACNSPTSTQRLGVLSCVCALNAASIAPHSCSQAHSQSAAASAASISATTRPASAMPQSLSLTKACEYEPLSCRIASAMRDAMRIREPIDPSCAPMHSCADRQRSTWTASEAAQASAATCSDLVPRSPSPRLSLHAPSVEAPLGATAKAWLVASPPMKASLPTVLCSLVASGTARASIGLSAGSSNVVPPAPVTSVLRRSWASGAPLTPLGGCTRAQLVASPAVAAPWPILRCQSIAPGLARASSGPSGVLAQLRPGPGP